MPNTFTCVICGKEVSKRKSLEYNGGRACKTHEEAQIALARKKEIEEAAEDSG